MDYLPEYRQSERREMNTKEMAHGKWESILSAYIDPRFLRNKHGECPLCGGVDRFRFDDKKGNGDYFCSGCGAGTGIHLLSQHQGCTYSEAWQLVERVIGSAVVAPKKEQVDQAARVREILNKCTKGVPGDFVDEYLSARGLQNTPESLLRGSYWINGSECQAMIARAAKGSKIAGIHATFIREGVKIGRRMYTVADGAMIGSAIRLHPLNGGSAIVIAEGIETALSASIMTGLPAWSCMDAGKMEKVILPEQVQHVVIAGDLDVSYTGQAAAYALAKRLKSEGKNIEVIFPKEVGTDFNDELKGLHK